MQSSRKINQQMSKRMFQRRKICSFWIVCLLLLSMVPERSFAFQSKTDSLLNLISTASEDSNKVELLLDLGWAFYNSKPIETVKYGHQAYSLSKSVNYKKGEVSALNIIGLGYDVRGEFTEAMTYYQLALELAETNDDLKMIPNIKNNMALIHQTRGDYGKAMEVFHEILNQIDEEEQQGLASVLLNNIGNIHSIQENHPKALEYYERSLAIERKLDYPIGISTALSNMGNEYQELDEMAKAFICFKEALSISQSVNDKAGEAIILSSIGELQQKKGLLDLADEYYPQALSIAKEIGDQVTEVEVLNRLASLRIEQENYSESVKFAKESLQIAREIGNKEGVKENLETLAKSHAAMRDFEAAYEYQNLFSAAKDSLYDNEKSKQIIELATQYETQKKEAENKLLKDQQAKNEVIIQQRTFMGVAIAAILGLMSILAFVMFSNYRQKNKYSRKLEEEVASRTNDLEDSNTKLRASNKELERFAYIASHDLKEPLRNIMSFAKLVERRLPEEVKKNKDIAEYMSYIFNNTIQMHSLIEDVLEYSRIDNLKIQKEEVDLNELVVQVTKMLGSTLRERNVELKVGTLPKVIANNSKLFIVVKNLIENGLKYNDSFIPKIWIQSRELNKSYEISITDNGIGIDAEYKDQIFGMFKRLHNREEYQGSGLGLSICQKIIHTFGGEIWVESEIGQGSKFKFTIPKSTKEMETKHSLGSQISPVDLRKMEINN